MGHREAKGVGGRGARMSLLCGGPCVGRVQNPADRLAPAAARPGTTPRRPARVVRVAGLHGRSGEEEGGRALGPVH